MLLPALSPHKTFAGLVPPASSFSEVVVATGIVNDATINCDMVSEPAGYVKAIVWSNNPGGFAGNPSGYTPSSYLYAENPYGNSDILTLPHGAAMTTCV